MLAAPSGCEAPGGTSAGAVAWCLNLLQAAVPRPSPGEYHFEQLGTVLEVLLVHHS